MTLERPRLIWDQVRWGVAACQARGCLEPAAGILDERELRCLACLELELDRAEAVRIAPSLRSTLPALHDR